MFKYKKVETFERLKVEEIKAYKVDYSYYDQ